MDKGVLWSEFFQRRTKRAKFRYMGRTKQNPKVAAVSAMAKGGNSCFPSGQIFLPPPGDPHFGDVGHGNVRMVLPARRAPVSDGAVMTLMVKVRVSLIGRM